MKPDIQNETEKDLPCLSQRLSKYLPNQTELKQTPREES
jgi:hypothetical protein